MVHPLCLRYAGCALCGGFPEDTDEFLPEPVVVRPRAGMLLRRAAAVLADTVLLLVPALATMATTGLLLHWPLWAVLIVSSGAAVTMDLVNIGLFLGEGGMTLGKKLFGIRVVDERGCPLGWRRALKRELLLKGISTFSLGLGFLLALRSGGRAWHDDVGGTEVLPAGVDPQHLLPG